MKRLANAFSYIFSDVEWFNKVLIGGIFLLLIPFGIGIIMLNGFLIDFAAKQKNGEKGMPFWRNYKTIFKNGLKISTLSLILIVLIYCFFLFMKVSFTIPIIIVLTAGFLTVNSVILIKSLDVSSLVVSFVLIVIAISIGWMWIVVGWPLLIFLAVLVQIHLFTNR